jgi:hypothetical protein
MELEQLARLAHAIASAAPAEAEGHAPPAAPAPGVVAHVHARAVGRRLARVALLHQDGLPARHARRVVHPRRHREVSRRNCNKNHHAGQIWLPHISTDTTMPSLAYYLPELGGHGLITGNNRGHENEEDARAGRGHPWK